MIRRYLASVDVKGSMLPGWTSWLLGGDRFDCVDSFWQSSVNQLLDFRHWVGNMFQDKWFTKRLHPQTRLVNSWKGTPFWPNWVPVSRLNSFWPDIRVAVIRLKLVLTMFSCQCWCWVPNDDLTNRWKLKTLNEKVLRAS